MREFTGAFLGTIAAILFVVGVVSWFVWREAQKLETKHRDPKREPELEREPDPEQHDSVAAPREVVHPSQVPS